MTYGDYLSTVAAEIEGETFCDPDDLLAEAVTLAEFARENAWRNVRVTLTTRGSSTACIWSGHSSEDFDVASSLFRSCDKLFWCRELEWPDHSGSWAHYLARQSPYSLDRKGRRVAFVADAFDRTAKELDGIVEANGYSTAGRRGEGTATAQRDVEAEQLEAEWMTFCHSTSGRATYAMFANHVGHDVDFVTSTIGNLRQRRRDAARAG